MSARIGIDVGGTFTDVVLACSDGRVSLIKIPTTPDDPGIGATEGVRQVLAKVGLQPAQVAEIVHGTTIASNTILQKTGARTGLLTTAGFRDVLEIGRIRTPGMFDLAWTKPAPLVPRRWRLEVTGRIAADGSEVTPLDEDGVRRAAATFLAEGIEAVAICFINSYANPEHELRTKALLAAAAPGLLLTASSEVLPEIKEYERTSTAVVNAYLLPAMRTYLSRLANRLAEIGVSSSIQIMASSGGTVGPAAAQERPVFIVGSGPAGAVVGAARLAGRNDLLVFDMGGTTAKAALVEAGKPSLVTEYEFRDGISTPSRFTKGAGIMLKVPAIDVAEVGSGGGSLASIDAGGLLVVGPASAGADPGPACYCRGNDRPTVTDANMVLGLLNPEFLAGGSVAVDPDRSARAVETHVAQPLGINLTEAARGIRAVANATMARALRAVTVERGHDPRQVTLMACGGSGPLHAVELAEALGIARILVAPMSGVFSAAGMLSADIEHNLVQALLLPLDDAPMARVQAVLDELMEKGRRELAAEGYDADAVQLSPSLDLRYLGQSSELTVPLSATTFDAATRQAAIETFRAAYRATFSYRSDEPLELVNIRLIAVGHTAERLSFNSLKLDEAALHGVGGRRKVWFREGPAVEAELLPRAAVTGRTVQGPAIIESYDTTIALPPGATARAAEAGAILIEVTPDA